ncbi:MULTISPECIES: LysR family transcriptional regulator [unclassified Agarivorans]|uniref:LysR family transcriptional regulator n=1 Tax=unclassified Agarivorans TaxID=2636026 RepID=UPI003D7D86D1
MLNSQDLQFFVVIAASRSLAAAARTMNVTPPSVSQRLKTIEQKLGVSLVERTARAISLTSEGQLLAERGRLLLTHLAAISEDISTNKLTVSGHLRLVAPLGLGTKHIGPIIGEFQQLYPLTEIELILSDAPKWSVHQSPDLLLYIGALQDSSLKRVVLAQNQRLLLASPSYLATAPALVKPADLAQHRCIVLRENDEDASMWRFTETATRTPHSVRVEPHLASNVGQVTKDWCLAGRGLMLRSGWDVNKELAQGQLLPLLPDYSLAAADIVALLSADSDHRAKKVTVFLDFLKEKLRQRLA